MLKKIMMLFISIILLVFVAVSFCLISIFSFDSFISEKDLLNTEYVIILGAKVNGDQPSPKLKERLDFWL